MKTVRVIGLPLACTDYQGAVTWIFEKARCGSQAYAVEAANTHVAAMSRHERSFRATMERFDLIVPDGMPLVWSLNLQLPESDQLEDRVYGPTLMLETIKASERHDDLKHFLLGGKESTLESLQTNLDEQFPEATIAGSYSPPFGEWPEDEFERICAKIVESGANLIWVGLGCPKQEDWIARHKDRLPAGVYFGIGAAFAFHAGEVSQAPAVIQKAGLEWAYRLAAEPRRLFKRYLVHNSLFVWYSLWDHARAR
ncbi:WecB/TagA/CpsF family glycosyltransferase [Haloferula rosea]|uniref:WecB/TagA/CpsF family glycosyltransferase n=1 Tax=Haloferula rosea TaxID=490093 RepID=A0A934RBV8_9BACT|nr:WecB/TagA/CpsF family glycosyltransferase [Haloferula rosea]MBK1827798.1 WecB/TagA/CpsF family glycosyltransferase [Haloferula rosea]